MQDLKFRVQKKKTCEDSRAQVSNHLSSVTLGYRTLALHWGRDPADRRAASQGSGRQARWEWGGVPWASKGSRCVNLATSVGVSPTPAGIAQLDLQPPRHQCPSLTSFNRISTASTCILSPFIGSACKQNE